MKRAIHQIRLAIAETLIHWAVHIAPQDHPNSREIYEAALHVASRRPT